MQKKLKNNIFFLILLKVFSGWCVYGQSENTLKPENSYFELPRETLEDTKRIILSPVKWTWRDWGWAGGAVSATALCLAADEPVQSWVQNNQSPMGDAIATYVGEPLGNSLYVIGGSLVVYATGKISKNEEVAQPGLTVFKATLIAGGAAGVLKFLTHRARPGELTPPDAFHWEGPSFSTDNLSFVSAHSATAFAMASSLSTYYSEHKWVAWVSYPLAATTAWSRVYHNKHWLSDVVGGAALGIFIGKTVAMPDKYKWSTGPNAFGGTSVWLTYQF